MNDDDDDRATAEWYRRNRFAVDTWLTRNPPEPGWPSSPEAWARLEMPNPETVVGRMLLKFGA